MRVFVLIAFAIVLPASVHAAEPTLLTYTVSNDTIYPSAAPTSGMATTTTIDTAFSEAVKVSIKIVSSSGALIKSLYTSSSVTNPTPKIWDGMNTAGSRVSDGTYTILISATSTATDAVMTDTSKTVRVASTGSDTPGEPATSEGPSAEVASSTASTPSSGGVAEYLPIPSLRILAGGSRTVSSAADTAFTASVYDSKGHKRPDAVITWSFGDGMQRTGANVFHAFYEPGEYAVVVHAKTPDDGDALAELVITVRDAGVKIASVSARGITLTNPSSRTLDLSHWRFLAGGQEFRLPADTQILAGRTVLFPQRVTGLPLSDSTSLLYPSGEVAATYPATTPAVVAQPLSTTAGYSGRQEVEPVTRKANIPIHADAVIVPAVATEVAAAGAALPPPLQTERGEPKSTSIFRSPWLYSFLGVVAVAGAFVFL